MPFYWGDYWRDTAHLSDAEHVSYLRLISHYWQHGSLPTDDERLSRIAGRSLRDWKKMRGTISSFFSEDWKHNKVETVRKKQKEARDNASLKAQIAANVRWGKQTIEQCSKQSFGYANQYPNNKVNKNTYNARSSSALGASSLAETVTEIEPELKADISRKFDELAKALAKKN